MSYEDLISTNIIQKINYVMDQVDMTFFVSGIRSIVTQVYLIDDKAALRMESIVEKALVNYKEQLKKIPSQQLMCDPISMKKKWKFYMTECDNNCKNYIMKNIRKIIKDEYILS